MWIFFKELLQRLYGKKLKSIEGSKKIRSSKVALRYFVITLNRSCYASGCIVTEVFIQYSAKFAQLYWWNIFNICLIKISNVDLWLFSISCRKWNTKLYFTYPSLGYRKRVPVQCIEILKLKRDTYGFKRIMRWFEFTTLRQKRSTLMMGEHTEKLNTSELQ